MRTGFFILGMIGMYFMFSQVGCRVCHGESCVREVYYNELKESNNE